MKLYAFLSGRVLKDRRFLRCVNAFFSYFESYFIAMLEKYVAEVSLC